MDILNIQSLIAQGLITEVASIDPNKAYITVGVYQPGNRPAGSGNNTYASYAIPVAEFLASGGTYTGSNGITLVGNDFQLASHLISQFTNDSGYITGSGTLGKIPFWFPNGTTLGDSPLYTNGTQVGLNNITPSAMFDVLASGSGTVGISLGTTSTQDAKLYFSTNNALTARAQVYVEDATQTLNVYTVNNDTVFWNGNGLAQVETLRLSTNNNAVFSGNLGIGTPSESIRVAILSGTNGDYEAIKSYSNNGLQYSQLGWGGLESSYYLKLKSASGQPILLLPSTNVGITETNPTARLHIKGLDSTSSNYALKVDNSASSPLLYVNNNGNVGIGIAPSIADVKLEVKVATNQRLIFGNFPYPIGAALTLQAINDATTDVVNVVTLGLDWYHASRNNLFSNPTNTIIPTAKVHIIGNNQGSDLYALKVDNLGLNPLFYVRNDGNVGIGLSTIIPSKLSIATDTTYDGIWLTNNAGSPLAIIGKNISGGLQTGFLDIRDTNAEIKVCLSLNQFSQSDFINTGLSFGIGNFTTVTSALGKIHVKGVDSTTLINQRLEPVIGVTEDTIGNTIGTTDATVNVTAQTIHTSTDKVVSLESTIVYRKTSGAGVGTTGDGTTIKLNSSVKNVGGTLTLDTVQNTYTGTTNAIVGAVATYTISGTTVLVSVTGVVNNNITWNVITKVNTVA